MRETRLHQIQVVHRPRQDRHGVGIDISIIIDVSDAILARLVAVESRGAAQIMDSTVRVRVTSGWRNTS